LARGKDRCNPWREVKKEEFDIKKKWKRDRYNGDILFPAKGSKKEGDTRLVAPTPKESKHAQFGHH
jgi:hypothetical protein